MVFSNSNHHGCLSFGQLFLFVLYLTVAMLLVFAVVVDSWDLQQCAKDLSQILLLSSKSLYVMVKGCSLM